MQYTADTPNERDATVDKSLSASRQRRSPSTQRRDQRANAIDLTTRHAVQAFLDQAARLYAIEQAVLFGSRARQDHRADSDADVALTLRGPHGPFLDTKLALADIAYDVLLETGILVQPLPLWRDDWEHPETTSTPALLAEITRDGIPL
jgi:predicted nucleotidyltransferase